MSYLAEVLSSAEKVEIEQISAMCPELIAAADKAKANMVTFVDNVYIRFTVRPRQHKVFANHVNQLKEDIHKVVANAKTLTNKDLTNSEQELKRHLDGLAKTKTQIELVEKLCKIHELMIDISSLSEAKCYLHSMEKILEADRILLSFSPEENLACLEKIKHSLVLKKTFLLSKLMSAFEENVILEATAQRKVLKIDNESENLQNVLTTLYLYKTSISPLDNITRFLWDEVFVPVVDCTTAITTSVEDGFHVLDVTIIDPHKKVSYSEVFGNLQQVLNFLSSHFDLKLSGDFSSLNYIGRDIRDNLSEIIIKHCLQDTIPSTQEELRNYETVIESITGLVKSLVSAKIFTEDTTSILDFTSNIDVYFINEKCENYLTQAQILMKKDLHDLTEVGSVDGPESSLNISKEFSRCAISKNVLEIVNLQENILEEAAASSEMCAGRLLGTVRNICRKYILFVPEHHKKLLQTIPQQIAVFYNNCMYISYNIIQWNKTHLNALPSVLNVKLSSFNDEGRQLREVASEMFAHYVSGQIKEIEQIMRDANLNQQTLKTVDGSTEKCLRQCLRQQELLKTVWHKTLPYAVYNETLGSILNSLCTLVVGAVVKVDDISSDAAEQLVEMLKMVQTRGSKLFTDPKEVSLFVSSWSRVNELLFVLNASLVDINDRWADGKGPLALQFKPEELKQLIRALFQNTERRSLLLAKIHC